MESNTMCCQEVAWFVQCWQWALTLAVLAVGKSTGCVCCRIRFSSSVNVADYFLRDQNWLPTIGPPSIFRSTSRTQAEGGGVKQRFMGKRERWCLLSEWGSGQATRYSIPASAVTFVTRLWGKINNAMLKHYLGGYVFFLTVTSLLQMADKEIQTLLHASTGRRIMSAPSSTFFTCLPRKLQSPSSVRLCLCVMSSCINQTLSQPTCTPGLHTPISLEQLNQSRT